MYIVIIIKSSISSFKPFYPVQTRVYSCWWLPRTKKKHLKPDTSGSIFPAPPRQRSNFPDREDLPVKFTTPRAQKIVKRPGFPGGCWSFDLIGALRHDNTGHNSSFLFATRLNTRRHERNFLRKEAKHFLVRQNKEGGFGHTKGLQTPYIIEMFPRYEQKIPVFSPIWLHKSGWREIWNAVPIVHWARWGSRTQDSVGAATQTLPCINSIHMIRLLLQHRMSICMLHHYQSANQLFFLLVRPHRQPISNDVHKFTRQCNQIKMTMARRLAVQPSRAFKIVYTEQPLEADCFAFGTHANRTRNTSEIVQWNTRTKRFATSRNISWLH